MKKIVIIGVYFGTFQKNFNLWLKSCEYNPTIDFKIFTNQNLKSKIKNVEYINMPFEKFNKLIKKKIGNNFAVSSPYKCCDFKPVYGIILEDYIKEYVFWGHCDFDMIFGDIRHFITDEILEKYDKILPLGHLSLYRNTTEVNNRYMDEGSNVGNYKEVFSRSKNVAFDELCGIGQIYIKNNYSFYNKRIFADISIMHKRFCLALNDKNYKYQVFYWEKGHIYRAYEENNKIKTEEFIYIHFKQRKYLEDLVNNKNDNFYICDLGFITKAEGLPTLSDIKKYNKYKCQIYEIIEKVIFKIKFTIKGTIKRIKERINKE